MPTDHSQKQSRVNGWGTFLSLVVLLLLAFVGLRDWMNPYNDMEFSKAEWGRRKWEERASMVDDLLEKHLKPGMSRNEIEELLGPPDSEGWSDYFGRARKDPVEELIYEMGSWYFHGSDDNFLEVSLDSSGNMTQAWITGF